MSPTFLLSYICTAFKVAPSCCWAVFFSSSQLMCLFLIFMLLITFVEFAVFVVTVLLHYIHDS
jgi:hypothetical protein